MATTGLNPRPLPGPRTRSGERGFTLLEMLMAALILAVGLLGLAALQISSVSQGTTSRQMGTATYIAHGILDRIQAEGAVTSAERLLSADGSVALNGRTFSFIDPVAGASSTSPAAGPSFTVLGLPQDDPYYTVNTSPGYTADKTLVYTTTWTRNAGVVYPYARTALQEFTVNVTWREYDAQNPNTPKSRAFSVSRYVRM
ncbi:MAG TPA: prepilin-type N-terminal cleavage/methylation domain-containing protein [Holophaga sp.]|nr:prepilin-type N-terminal cleavage/methylation domain-containing protein [Holophaga sp.]